MKFSASQLKTWQSCSLQAKFSYIDKKGRSTGSSALFGSCVHEALELLNKGVSLEDAEIYFLDNIQSREPDYWNRRTSLTGFKDKGVQMLRDYAAYQELNPADVIASEFRFMVDVGEHQVSGIVDAIELPHDHSSLDVIDYKTGRRPILDTLHLDIQMTIYQWASMRREFWTGYPGQEDKYQGIENGEEFFEYFKDIPRKAYWFDLKTAEPIYVGDRTGRDFGRLYRLIEQVARAVEYDVYVPTLTGDTCTWCDHTDICPVYFDRDKN